MRKFLGIDKEGTILGVGVVCREAASPSAIDTCGHCCFSDGECNCSDIACLGWTRPDKTDVYFELVAAQ